MDKQRLDTELQALINATDSEELKIFLKLLRQVWQIDWTVAPYDVWTHYIEYDIPYFRRFMELDIGDEAEEMQLLQDWISSRAKLGGKDTGSNWKEQLKDLIEQVNRLRSTVRQAARG